MNFASQEWKDVCKEIDKRVESLDRMNRGPLDIAQTSDLRGQIKALQSLRQWNAAPPVEEEISYLR